MINKYAQSNRRVLRRFPEFGFELPQTFALLRRQFDDMGAAYTEEYGKSSLAAILTPEKEGGRS